MYLQFFLFFLSAFGENRIPPTECKRLPAFVQKIGFDPQRSGFSTSERKQKGLVYVEFSADGDASKNKTYQRESWKQAGSMGPIVIDEEGNVFVAPIPMVNILENPPEKQNTFYKLDSQTGEMASFVDLPDSATVDYKEHPEQNPFGLLGMAYDCETRIIYAASVKGSSRDEEAGCIWAIRKNDKKILGALGKIDAMGIGVGNQNGEKRIFLGKTRSGDIVSYSLNSDGTLKAGSERLEASLEGLGARGDDRARKIRFNERNEMVVQGIEFYYNLIAPTEKQETIYVFRYNPNAQRWFFVRFGA